MVASFYSALRAQLQSPGQSGQIVQLEQRVQQLEYPDQKSLHKAPSSKPGRFSLPTGKLIEISGESTSARMTTAVSALLAAQSEGETAAWIQPQNGPLYPPDLADSGVDLAALIVVHVPAHAGFFGFPKAGEILLRSGGYGLLVIDLCDNPPTNSDYAWQARLQSLAREHQSQLLILTHKPAHKASLSSLVSIRIAPCRKRQHLGVFRVQQEILKNKSGLLNNLVAEERRGPWGLL